MQAIIKKAKAANDRHSLLIVIDDPEKLNVSFLTSEQIDYFKKQFKEKDKQLFEINLLKRFIFIYKPKKEENYYKSVENSRLIGEKLTKILNEQKIKTLLIIGDNITAVEIIALAEGIVLSNYQFLKYKSNFKDKVHSLMNIYIKDKRISSGQIEELNTILESTYKCRDLVNEPLSSLNAMKLAEEFTLMAQKAGIKAEVMKKKRIEALKMGGLLAVNRGSPDPPTFTVLEWKPENAINKDPYVLVGKGVVYDTGGMSLKPASGMLTMKCDMAGAATMVSVVYAVAKQKLPVYIVALLPATDNRVDGNAYVPGDIITMYDGTSVEIINTDAEGRMILADALSYAKKYKPQLVINMATLTGSAARAIGKYGIVGMSSSCDEEFASLSESGWNVYERLAVFPFWDEYKDTIKSDIADIKNIGGTDAGAITAGKFLEHFTSFPFIHLDIAGVAFLEKKDSYRGLGATGTGVRLLYDFFKRKV